jgi:metallo-beta-lactamase class B
LPVTSSCAAARGERGACTGRGCADAANASANEPSAIHARNFRHDFMRNRPRNLQESARYRPAPLRLKSLLPMAGIDAPDFARAPNCGLVSAREGLMTRHRSACLLAGLAASVASAQPPPAAPDSPAVAAIVARARAAAGDEWGDAVEFFCGNSGRPNRADDPLLEPTRVFDNLYALGRTGTVVWALTTPEGILLIDAGYPDQLESVLLPQMRAAGLDPAAVRYVLVGHGHSDHFGGASYFQQRGARVALSAADWDLVENPPPAPPGAPAAAGLPPPRRDVVVADGEPITFGGIEITPVLIPGHTPGALGFVFRVTDGARAHTAALFGGSILLVSRIPDDGLRQYVQSIERFGEVTRRLGVDVEIQNHPLYDGFEAKLARLEARRAGDAHPFVVGADSYQRFLTVMSECANAQLARR